MIVIIAVAVTAATGAFFTDTTTSATSTLSSGTLSLDVNENDSAESFEWTLADNLVLAPGDSTDWVDVIVKNDGAMPLAWFGHFNVMGDEGMEKAIYIKDAKMAFLTPDGGSWAQPDFGYPDPAPDGPVVDQFITDGIGSGRWPVSATSYDFGKISLDTWNTRMNIWNIGVGNNLSGALNPGYAYKFSFRLGMAEEAGNLYQNQSLSLSLTVDATQTNDAALDSFLTSTPGYVGPNHGHNNWLRGNLDYQIVP